MAYLGGHRALRLQPAALASDPPGLDSVARAGLADRRRQVVAHRALGEVQAAGDLGDRCAPAARLDHLALTGGERALAVRERGGGELGVDYALPGRGAPDRVGESLRGRVLDQ